MKNKLSIIVPFYYGEVFLPKLLNSLFLSYNNSNKNILVEVIIIFDSPNINHSFIDEQKRTFLLFDIKTHINESNLGVDKSRDLGVILSSGEYLTFIDQDDNVSIEYFKIIENQLTYKEDLYVLNGYVNNILDDKKIPIFYYKPRLDLMSLIQNNKILTPSLLVVRKDLIISRNINFTLPIDNYKGIDDWFFILQIIYKTQNFNFKYIDNKLINYCIHDNNYSNDIIEPIKGSVELLKYLLNDLHIYKDQINSRIDVLKFMELYYSKNNRFIIFKNPVMFFKFLAQYVKDINRIIRFLNKILIGLKIHNN